MALGEKLTPVDTLTGMPLPVISRPEDYILINPDNETEHHAFHPAKHELLQGIGGIALRNCRIQLIPAELHNHGKHNYHSFFAGPPLPEEESDQFALTVLACAGYIPKMGIDVTTRAQPKVFEMSDEQMMALRTMSGTDYRNFSYNNEFVREFFEYYALKRDWSYLRESTVEEFLTSKDLERRQYLGHFILAKAVEMATDGVNEKYLIAHREGLLHPQAPVHPREIVKMKIARKKHKERLFKNIETVLAEQFGLAA